ncbi:hypothetical protein ABIC55_003653 [Sporosarcina psychrophila]|uniref:Capsid protein n=2 Tax=Sporosarcina psychrophila TaxID=1476 RepID=A0ABV2KBT9_SPOPS
MALIYRAVNEVKPAHLAFGITAIVREVIRLTTKQYDFPVTYRITNTFRTADITGGLARFGVGFEVKPYAFEVIYPIANMFTVDGYAAQFKEAIGMDATANSNKVTYARVGVATAWGGDLTATVFADIGGIKASSSGNGVLYPRVGEADVRKGIN